MNSPVVGLGAGVFSGISGPLQQFESHNTFIDLMTNGGIILSVLFYYPFIRTIISLYKDNPYKYENLDAAKIDKELMIKLFEKMNYDVITNKEIYCKE